MESKIYIYIIYILYIYIIYIYINGSGEPRGRRGIKTQI